MSWPDPEDERFEPRSDLDAGGARGWPLDHHSLLPRERWLWFERLWSDVSRLRDRYRLPVRCGWWEHELQVEALAALAAWVERYDCGEWDDPPRKLALLYDLEHVAALLRDGSQPFHSDRDRPAFTRHLIDLGCEPPLRSIP